MLKRILKSWKFWLIVLLSIVIVALYLSGVITRLVAYVDSTLNPPEDISVDEALQQQAALDWNYNDNPITANVIGTDPENGTLSVSFVWPTGFINERFENERPVPDQTVKITCSKEDSAYYITRVPKSQQDVTKMEAKLDQTGINIIEMAQSGDSIIGLCANEECSEINRSCQLHRTFLVEE